MCVSVHVQGVSLAQAKEKGQLVFLEGLNESLSVLIPQETNTGSQAMNFLRYKPVSADSSINMASQHIKM